MSASPAWSEDRVATLSKLWRDGLSAAQIAIQLGGVTRNAVIGKVHRLGLSRRAAPSAPATAPRPARKATLPRRRPAPVGVATPPTPAMEAAGRIASVMQLGAHICRWPIGDPKQPGFSFCGHPADGRYCTAHERLGTRPGTAWRADRDPVVRRALAGLV